MGILFTQRHRQRGFTLLELSVTLAIMAILAAMAVPNLMAEINEKRANVAIQETQTIVDAARKYRSDNGSWPGGATCLGAINTLLNTTPPMLAGVTQKNKFNYNYSTSCTAFTFSLEQRTAPDWDGVMSNGLPGTIIVAPATNRIRTTIGIPGSEPALDSKLSRVATGNAELNRMRTDLLLGNQNIREIRNVSTATVTASGAISAGSLSTSGNALVGGSLTARGVSQFDGVATFNQPIRLNRVVTVGSGCSPNGAIARDSAGKTISCQSGRWKANSAGEVVISRCECSDCGHRSGRSCTPSCPSGYTLTSKVDSGDYSVTHNRHRIWVGVCQR